MEVPASMDEQDRLERKPKPGKTLTFKFDDPKSRDSVSSLSLPEVQRSISGKLSGGKDKLKLFRAKTRQFSDLNSAAQEGDADTLRELLENETGPDINACHSLDKRTVLHIAAAGGHLESVKLLVDEFRAATDVLDEWGATPLDDARFEGHKPVVEYLEKLAESRRLTTGRWTEILRASRTLRRASTTGCDGLKQRAARASTAFRASGVVDAKFLGNEPWQRQCSIGSDWNRQFSSPGSDDSEDLRRRDEESEHLINLALPDDPSIFLFRASAISSLPVPWPRCQEFHQDFEPRPLPKGHKPRVSDLVVAVSHMWFFQVHPDPLGEKVDVIKKLVHDAEGMQKPEGDTLLFIDFLSISQRPVNATEADRTSDELAAFKRALRVMPLIYLHADAIVLLDTQRQKDVPGDGGVVTVPADEVQNVLLRQIGTGIQVAKVAPRISASKYASSTGGMRLSSTGKAKFLSAPDSLTIKPQAAPFDYVLSGNGKRMFSIKAIRKICDSDGTFQIEKAPYGKRSTEAPGERGWIYLERFIAIVKVAMTGSGEKVVFSDSPSLLKEIFDAGRALRLAAKEGPESLRTALQIHVETLKLKVFSAVSLDKAKGIAVPGSEEARTSATAKYQSTGSHSATGYSSSSTTSDRDAVEGIMRDMVDRLTVRWEEKRSQMIRLRFSKAVKRVVKMLEDGTLPPALEPFLPARTLNGYGAVTPASPAASQPRGLSGSSDGKSMGSPTYTEAWSLDMLERERTEIFDISLSHDEKDPKEEVCGNGTCKPCEPHLKQQKDAGCTAQCIVA